MYDSYTINLLSCRHSDLKASAPMITSAGVGHEQPAVASKYIGHLLPLLFALWGAEKNGKLWTGKNGEQLPIMQISDYSIFFCHSLIYNCLIKFQ